MASKKKPQRPFGKLKNGRKPSAAKPVKVKVPLQKKGMGRPVKHDHGLRNGSGGSSIQASATRHALVFKKQTEASAKYRDLQASEEREGIDLSTIDWDVREACRLDNKLFADTYLPNVFNLPWSDDQLEVNSDLKRIILHGGNKAVAMPRGGGKTALCRANILWGTLYGHVLFPFFVGSKQDKAVQTLDAVKMYLYSSKTLLRDFPEICYAILRLGNRSNSARGQLYRGYSTHIKWESQELRFPCLVLGEDDIKHYPEKDLIRVDDVDGWIVKNAGVVIRTEGIDGSIRGEAEIHPYLLTQPRPDCILLDDVQKDQKADSPISCEKLEALIEGAVDGLSGPDQLISGLMPCTVIRPDDVSDTYLDRVKKPHWNGSRYSMVRKWPEGITDETINPDTQAGKLWLTYDDLRKKSLREKGDIRLATAFYKTNRKEMDEGFECSWPDRFFGSEKYEGNQEISAQQNAMNLRLKNLFAFAAERQNRPIRRTAAGTKIMTAAEFLEDRIVNIPRFELSPQDEILVGMIDVQNECLFYKMFSCELDFTGRFVDYGTWPDFNRVYYTKADAAKWAFLSKMYFARHPDAKPAGVNPRDKKTPIAPLEGKLYLALRDCCNMLFSRRWVRPDGTEIPVKHIGIDCKWGKANDTINRFVQEYRNPAVIPYQGKYIGAASRSFDEWVPRTGMLVGPFWVMDNSPKVRGLRQMQVDVNAAKSFLHERLSTPKGNPGAVTVFEGSVERHEVLADHICKSEYIIPETARGRTVDRWEQLPENPDNDYLDTAAGCMALASFAGAQVTLIKPRSNITGEVIPPVSPAQTGRTRKDGRRETLTEVWNRKRSGRG